MITPRRLLLAELAALTVADAHELVAAEAQAK